MMKKTLSYQDYVIVGYYLKAAHIATLKASVLLANRDGKTKKPFQSLTKINEDLCQFRCELENKLYSDYYPALDDAKLRQKYLGKLDRKLKLMFSGKNIFF
jgi:hypothetical protein